MKIWIYQYIIDYNPKKAHIEEIGLLDIDYNQGSNSQDDIYKNPKELRVVFNAGAATFREYQEDITKSITNNNCHVKVLLSNKDILQNGMYMSDPNETDITKKIISNIIDAISKSTHSGSIELRYSPIAPIGSVEIRDDKCCVVVPYIYRTNSAISYHTIYKNTGDKNDIYHKWVKHFETLWENAKSDVILKYPQ